jgi:glycosyltransferase involved in cell wall biosynthesis
LRSVMNQSVPPAEIIVVDDCSTDGTPERVKAVTPDARVIRLEKNSGGCSRPRNVGIQAARTKFIAPFDSDDIMEPRKLELQSALLERQPEVDVCVSDFIAFGDPARCDGVPHCRKFAWFRRHLNHIAGDMFTLKQAHAFESLMHENFIGSGAIIFRKKAWEAVGGYDEKMPSAEDLDFSLRLSERFRFSFVDQVLHRYRIHPQGKSSNKIRNYGFALATLKRYEKYPMIPAMRHALLQQVLDFETDLACLCSDAGRVKQALGHWWQALRIGGFSRRLLRPSRKLVINSAMLWRRADRNPRAA